MYYTENSMICSECGGAKYIERGAGRVRCRCLIKALQEAAWRKAWIPAVYWPLTWEDMKGREADGKTLKAVRRVEARPEKAMQDRLGLFLSGPAGSCKTTVATLLAKEWALVEEFKVRYVLYSSIYRARCGEENAFPETVDSILDTTNLLILDEVGREPVTKTGYEKLVLDEVMRRRETCEGQYGLGAVTVITTNTSLKDMRVRYSDNVHSLLQGRYLDLVLRTKDIRQELGKIMREEWMG